MKKLVSIMLVLVLVLAVMVGCGSNTSSSIKDESASSSIDGSLDSLEPITLTIAHGEAGDSTNHIHGASLAFKKYVEEKSEGKITVEVSPGGALGDADACMQQIMSGTLEISGSIADGSLAAAYPDFLAYSIPYLFENEEQALHVYHGDVANKIWEGFANEVGAYPLATLSAGFRMTTNNTRPIHTADDFKGMQIRTMSMPAHMEIIKNLGATATPIAWVELYAALQTGVVDGQENGIPSIVMGNLYEVQKYLTLDGHVWTTDTWVMSKIWFDALPYTYQNIIREGGMVMQEVGQRICAVETNIGMDFLPTVMEVYNPTAEEIQTFRDKTQAPVSEFIKKNVKNPEIVDELIEAADKALYELGYKK